jgi:hypothetical protein
MMQIRTSHINLTLPAMVFFSALLISGCSASKNSEQGESFEAKLRAAEANFRPSDHDPLPEHSQKTPPGATDTVQAPSQAEAVMLPAGEMVQGFRVQVFSSTNIDQSRAKKAQLEELYPDEWFYLDYASPSYRIRAGNFLSRFEADRFARLMTEHGFSEAWAVPERVYKNAGRRPAPPPQVQSEQPGIK